MDLMNLIKTFSDTIIINIKTILSNIPTTIIYIGIIAGFFSTVSIWRQKPIDINKIVDDICTASKKLAFLSFCIITVYIIAEGYMTNVFYYLVFALVGAGLHFLINSLLKYLNVIGFAINILLAVFSGPVLIFSLWFLHTGELVDKIRRLF